MKYLKIKWIGGLLYFGTDKFLYNLYLKMLSLKEQDPLHWIQVKEIHPTGSIIFNDGELIYIRYNKNALWITWNTGSLNFYKSGEEFLALMSIYNELNPGGDYVKEIKNFLDNDTNRIFDFLKDFIEVTDIKTYGEFQCLVNQLYK